MKNFKLFLESKALEQLFSQEVIDGDVTITHRIDNIKTKRINGTLFIKTIDYGDLSHIQVYSINIQRIHIEVLENLPLNLKSLECWSNKITSLDNLPSSLKTLNCSNNKITSLDKLPSSLKTLYCRGNKITNLDNLPQGLETLECSNNKITSLDNLPQGLEYLNCGSNEITSLDNLPQGLETLICFTNKITSLDNLSPLKKIVYKNTPIHNLVEKYDTDGDNLNLAFLIKSLQLDSNIHTEADIHPILDLIPPDEYKSLSDLLSDLNINLKTHSSEEILNTLKHLV